MPGSPVQLASYLGGTPGLYGGSAASHRRQGRQLAFLEANLDKAAAFVAALNADPTLRWSGGTQVSVDELAAYFAELTPVLLTRDMRVTNHGFREGKPTPRQSILQAGQYVLVDIFGVPRARCECGNPLIPPVSIPTKPRYTGKPWAGFDPAWSSWCSRPPPRSTPSCSSTWLPARPSSGWWARAETRTPTGERPRPCLRPAALPSTTTTLAAESFDGMYTGKTTWYWNEEGIVLDLPESEAVVTILDGLVTGSVEQVLITQSHTSDGGPAGCGRI